jgi:hypothetical protein
VVVGQRRRDDHVLVVLTPPSGRAAGRRPGGERRRDQVAVRRAFRVDAVPAPTRALGLQRPDDEMSFFGGLAAGAASVASRRDRTGDQAAAGGIVVVGPAAATASSAERSDDGSSRPRRSARRRIPAAAFGLKQYLDRCGPVSSTSDKDDATASLGYSEVLSVQHSVGDAIPEFSQRPEDGTHCAAVEFHATTADGGGVSAGSSPNRVPCVAVAAADSFCSAEAGADRRQGGQARFPDRTTEAEGRRGGE